MVEVIASALVEGVPADTENRAGTLPRLVTTTKAVASVPKPSSVAGIPTRRAVNARLIRFVGNTRNDHANTLVPVAVGCLCSEAETNAFGVNGARGAH